MRGLRVGRVFCIRPLEPVTIIHTSESRLIPCARARVYEAILAFEDYPLWWPRKFHPRFQSSQLPATDRQRVGDRLAFTPVPGIWTGWEITAVTPMEQIRVAYFQGFHTGWGVWRFAPQQEHTLVSFEMRIVPKNLLFGLVYRLARVPRRHAAHMQEIFTGLEDYLQRSVP